ncbi:XdhC family protein [Vreelandella utahensis]|uniref:XdhC family protein n=1 Tax=Vreelandella halophila TaxID=86177 RepID=UPI000984ECDF|nr:XdhC family protein [Halomonas utahensis]
MPEASQDPASSVIEHVSRWLARGERAWLCTVLRTWGSSPRPPGSMLAVNAAGEWSGSVSGGCLEESLIREVVEGGEPLSTAPRLVDHGVTEEEQERWRLPCGGRMRLVVEVLEPDRHAGPVARVLDDLAERRAVTRRVDWSSGDWQFAGASVPERIEEHEQEFLHTIGPRSRMLMIGAGEVARYVGRMALMNGFSVALCEPRPLFLEGWEEPGIECHACLPDDLIQRDFNDAHCAILALGHDPRIDDMGLLAALETNAFYIGAMGSQRTAAQRRQRLYELGVTDSRMGRIHAPIGFSIGSKAPPEIAVATMAQVLAERYRLLHRVSRYDV